MSLLKPMTQYFRQSLIDSERLCPEDKDILPVLGHGKPANTTASYIALDHQCWHEGVVNQALAQQLIKSKQVGNKKPLTEVEVLLFPRVDMYRNIGGQGVSYKRNVLLPLVVFARLQLSGQLLPTDKGPWIPRVWLAPNESRDNPIGDFSRVDEFLTLNPFDGIELWPQLIKYCTALLAYTVGDDDCLNIEKGEDNNLGVDITSDSSIFDLEIHEEYQLTSQCLMQIDSPVTGAKTKLISVLEAIKDDEPSVPLYERYCSDETPELTEYKDLLNDASGSLAHVGQMTGEFPLSPKQRNATHHFIHERKGEILAINGPPGTGKTTLLRSVVANLWTQAAIDKAEPPLIVAASNNNQAVTNILESFANVNEEGLEPSLMGRWLPEVASYGLYFCAKNKANKTNAYQYQSPSGEGCMPEWQTEAFIKKAKPYFLTRISSWAGTPVNSVDDAKDELHKELLDTAKKIPQGFDYLKRYQASYKKLCDDYESVEKLQADIVSATQQRDHLTERRSKHKLKLDKLYNLWEQRSWWVLLLWWIPFIRKGEIRKTSRLLSEWDIYLQSHNDESVEQYFSSKDKEYLREIAAIKAHIDSRKEVLISYQEAKLRLSEWIAANKLESLISKSYPDTVNEICDRVLRFRMFKLATHYWEARWLIETQAFVDQGDMDKKSPVKVLRKLRRYAKLMPCFVSTFYMTPATFVAGKYTDSTWKDLPLFNEIDLLIVDEAGQASPEVAAVSFALAKKALVVGDTDQIEPVWAVPASIDRANLRLFGLLNSVRNYDDYWLSSGLLASGGNVMRTAQRQSYFHQFKTLQRGLYLTEHRRCYNEIISYSNDLVYKGVLEPKRGEPEQLVPWGCMSFFAVEGVSQTLGGSRSNITEAEAIASWIQHEKNDLIQYIDSVEACPSARERAVTEKLQESIGIITPFKKQATLIKNELSKVGITGLTVGTVHSLQGAERLIVLFSAVYGINDKAAGKFYDRSANMLNVAVSRAKDSFIVFGHPSVFGADSAGSPSGMLRKKLSDLNLTQELVHE